MPQIIDAKQKQMHSVAWRLRVALLLMLFFAGCGAAAWFVEHGGQEAAYCALWLQGAVAAFLHIGGRLELAREFYQRVGAVPFFVTSLGLWTGTGAALGLALAGTSLTSFFKEQ
jgi:hypothetical protein